MTPRSLVNAALTDALASELAAGDIVLIEHARQIAAPVRPTVMIRLDSTRPTALAGVGQARETTFSVIVLAAKTDPNGPADDELDALLEDVIAGIEAAPGLTWTTAKRAVYAETTPAYEITVTTHTTHTQPEEP